MTPDEAKAAALQALNVLSAARHHVVATNGLTLDTAQLVVATQAGSVAVSVPIPAPPPLTRPQLLALAARIERAIRQVQANFEVDVGRGFNSAGRGSLQPGGPGYDASRGYV